MFSSGSVVRHVKYVVATSYAGIKSNLIEYFSSFLLSAIFTDDWHSSIPVVRTEVAVGMGGVLLFHFNDPYCVSFQILRECSYSPQWRRSLHFPYKAQTVIILLDWAQ